MNTDVLHDKTSKYEKLAKPKKRIDRNVNHNAFNVKPGALSYQITDSLNKLAHPKKRQEPNESVAPDTSNKTAPAATGEQRCSRNRCVTDSLDFPVKYGTHRLINSDEQSKDAQETKKKKFLIDTYARIVAARNKRTSKRLQELAKPKNYSPRFAPCDEFDDYLQNMNKSNMKAAAPRPSR
ncbi:uncharacterized protein LOC117221956 isoform X1 [Megalopta genalis]|uniref:uncharacterized protein LOC117221956 isoform X1 n=1 Tax=Megalopta genalis TaxID=115081 RepID=UPI003FD525E6